LRLADDAPGSTGGGVVRGAALRVSSGGVGGGSSPYAVSGGECLSPVSRAVLPVLRDPWLCLDLSQAWQHVAKDGPVL
jgi:hypothetical protein